jgi:translation initiation factor 1
MKSGKKKIDTSFSADLSTNPFYSLNLGNLPQSEKPIEQKATQKKLPKRGRVEVRREKSGRGGKVVTTFKGINEAETELVLKELKLKCATGGTVKDGILELQGDKRDLAISVLEKMGYKPVRSGG